MEIGVQTQNVVEDEDPIKGFRLLAEAGFNCCDFSLNGYLKNKDIYQQRMNSFFDAGLEELKDFFAPHKEAAQEAGIRIHQMHMPYPVFVPRASSGLNDYLQKQMAPKSMGICAFLECPYIVVHGFKLRYYLGSEEAEWNETQAFLHSIAPFAAEHGITICIENLYDGCGGHLLEGPGGNARKAAERIDLFNKEYGTEVLGFCFDVGHANLVGLDMEQFLLTLGSRLKVLHIHDNDGVSDLHQIPFTFARTRENTSSTDWPGLIRGLRGIGFRGVLSFETAPVLKSFPEAMKPQVLSFIAAIGRYLEGEVTAG